MGEIKLGDERNLIYLTGVYLPSRESVEKAGPKNPKFLRSHELESMEPEDAFAHTLSAIARRRIYFRRVDKNRRANAIGIGLETWVLGPPTNVESPLASLFAGESPNTGIRLLIHHTVKCNKRSNLTPVWGDIHYNLRKDRSSLRLRYKIIPQSIRAELKRGFLQSLLSTYSERLHDPERFIQSTGHPYWVSDGLPVPPFT